MYTKNFNFYVPEVDDPNLEYVPGFSRNFEILDLLMSNLTSQSIVDPYAKNDSELKMKKAINDSITVKYQAHRDSFTNTTNVNRPESGSLYRDLIKENPHAVTPDQLMLRDDIISGQELESTMPQINNSGDIIYNPLLNSGHNAIISEINNINDDVITVRVEGRDVQVPRKRNNMISGYGKTKVGANGKTILDYSELYIQDIGNNITGHTTSHRKQERGDAKKYRNHKYLFVDEDNQVASDYSKHAIREEENSQAPYRDDFRRDKHVSDYDMFHFESHLQNIGHATSDTNKNKYSEMLINGKINVNPHKITATDLYDIDSINSNEKLLGKNAIIKELNKQIYNNINASPQKIYWNLIDKENINGSGGKANITDIPLRKHNDLQDIKELDLNTVNNQDTKKDKHISIQQGIKWENHVNTVNNNPHKVRAGQLYDKNGNHNAHIAIIQQINISEDISKTYNNDKILWNTIDKEDTDGLGTRANITDIPIRNHDDLQSIQIVDLNSIDFKKNKHISSMQLNSLYRYIEVKDGSNIHHVTANSLLGNDRSAPAKNNIANLSPMTNGQQQSIDIPFMPNNRDLYLDIAYDISKIRNSNIDLYFNNYYLGQIGNVSSYTYVIPKVYISNSNKIILYWNNSSIVNDVITSIKYYQPEKEYGRNAIIDEINRDNTQDDNNNNVEYKQILWKRIDTTGASITDFTEANHYDLQRINGYEIESDLNDPNSDNINKRNKHISHNDGKRWDTHINDTKGNNPHNTYIENIKGKHNRDGASAVIDALNKFSIDLNKKPTNSGSEEPVGISNYLRWDLVNKKNSNIADLTTRRHNDLQNILQVSLALNDTVGDKHISNAQGRKWEEHVDSISGIGDGGTLTSNTWKNPHKIVAASLYSHKNYSGNKNYNGGNAIVDAINDFSINKIQWDKISKTASSLIHIENRNHNDLQNILHVNANLDNESLYIDYMLHISQKEYDLWESHRINANNPHSIKAHQIQSSNREIRDGADALIEEINANSSNKIYWGNIDFQGSRDGERQFSIKDIPLRPHNDLAGGTFVVDGTGSPDIMGHITNRQVATYNNHVSNKQNPHNVTANQVSLGISDSELEENSLRSKNLRDIILEIDTFRNRTYSGLVSIAKNDDNPTYYFDKKYNLYVPEATVYLNNQSNFAGKIQLFTTPIGNYKGEKPDEIEFEKFWRISVEDLPKNNRFFIYAQYSNKTINIRVSTSRIQDGQSALLLIGFLRTETGNSTSSIVEGICFSNDLSALGLTEKILSRIINLAPFQRQSGLYLRKDSGDNDGLYFMLTSGSVWDGLQLRFTDDVHSKENLTSNKKIVLAYRQPKTREAISWNWTYEYNYTTALNTVYQNPDGGLSQVASSKIVCNFIYLDVFTSKIYILLSEKLLNSVDEFDKQGNQVFPSVIPDHIKDNCILCGILLCSKDDNNNFARIYSSFDTIYTNTTVSQAIADHALLININSQKYWHLNKTEYNDLSFILHDNVAGQESGFEKRITKQIVDKRIEQILTSNNISENLNTVTKIATLLNAVNTNKVNKNGDSLNGEYIFNSSAPNTNVVSINSKSSNVSTFIGNITETNNKQDGYFISYEAKDKKIHIYSQNGLFGQTFDDINNIEIMNINSLGNIDISTRLTSKRINISDSFRFLNGLTYRDNINLNNNDNKFGLILGSVSNQGTILLKHNIEQCSSVLRARNERFEIDGYGAIYLNTDLSRTLGSTQLNPAEPKGLKYKDNTTGQGVYDVYIGNIGSNESPIYPIKLAPNSKSLINGGLHLGTNINSSQSSSLLSINGNIDMMSNDISRIRRVYFDNNVYMDGNTIHLTNKNSLQILNNNNIPLSIDIDSTYSILKFNNKNNIKMNDSVELYYNNIRKLYTANNGVYINGSLYVDERSVITESRFIHTSNGLSGGGNLSNDLTLSLSPATNSTLGGVIIDSETINVNMNGLITAQGLKNDRFTMKYDNNIHGIVIEFM